jgi:hypothetical protein
VTTSAILRAEPDLVHRPSDDPDQQAAFRRWRVDTLGLRRDPELLILSHGGEIPPDHPALRGPSRPIVVTSESGGARLAGLGRRFEIVVVPDAPPIASTEQPGGGASAAGATRALARAIEWLRDERDARTIVLEAGPRATVGLYRERSSDGSAASGASLAIHGADMPGPSIARVDELLLAVFEGGSFPAVAGPELPSTDELARYFSGAPASDREGLARPEQPRTRRRIEEPSGPWLFERYRRRAAC